MSEVFTGRKGKFVSLNDTLNGFEGSSIHDFSICIALVDGSGDDYPEMAFYM